MMSNPVEVFQLICPECGDFLEPPSSGARRCARDDRCWVEEHGIWRMLSDSQRVAIEPRVRRYLEIRRTEGWGDDDPQYYRALPFVDRSARFPEIWRLRAQSYRHLQRRILQPLARARGSLRVIDAGAGNGWLSYRLARAGHRVAAVDICTDRIDGLGALSRYAPDIPMLVLEASFDQLPIAPRQADVVIFNSSLHYSNNVRRTMKQALGVLVAGGRIVVVDTPYYRREIDGHRMLAQWHADKQHPHDQSETSPMQGFLTPAAIARLCSQLGLEARTLRPPAAWRAAAAALRSRITGQRARAAFPLIEFAQS